MRVVGRLAGLQVGCTVNTVHLTLVWFTFNTGGVIKVAIEHLRPASSLERLTFIWSEIMDEVIAKTTQHNALMILQMDLNLKNQRKVNKCKVIALSHHHGWRICLPISSSRTTSTIGAIHNGYAHAFTATVPAD